MKHIDLAINLYFQKKNWKKKHAEKPIVTSKIFIIYTEYYVYDNYTH